jgi:glycosyltransferase involved in cell wall biosynthesis
VTGAAVPPVGVSVVVCCHNGAARLPHALAHLAGQVHAPGLSWEVIVVDNGSADGSAGVARACWPMAHPVPLRIVAEPRLGLAHARRRGMEEARYAYVSFVDDDNWLAPNWVETVCAVMTSRVSAGACGGRTQAVCEEAPPPWFPAFQEHFACGDKGAHAGEVGRHGRYLWGAGLTVRLEAWRGLVSAGYEPLLVGRSGRSLSSGEDSELCLALRLAGWQLWYDPALWLRHFMPRGRLTWRYLLQMQRGFGAAFPVLEAYHAQLNGLPQRRWQERALRAAARLCTLAAQRPLLLLGASTEGDAAALAWERALGRFLTLIRERSRCDDWGETVARLADRLAAAARQRRSGGHPQ